MPPRPLVGRRRHARGLSAMDAAVGRYRRGGADLGRVAAQGGRRGQPRAVDPPVGHLAARLDPLGLRKPLGDPSLSPENYGITVEDLRALPASLIRRPWPTTPPRCTRSSRRSGVLLDDRLRLRARVRARKSAAGCRNAAEGTVPCADRSDRSPRAARSPHPGRSLRALPASDISGQDPLLDRGRGHDGADPGRGDRRVRRRPASPRS